MMYRIAKRILIPSALLFALALPTSAYAANGTRTIPTLALSTHALHVAKACSKSIPDAWGPIDVWVYVNGSALKSPDQIVTRLQYFVGDGTLVSVREYAGNGPVCARALTWQRFARVTVRLQPLASA